MAIDTRNRRASCLGINGTYRAVYPNPDGSLATQDDRQHMAYSYPGISAAAPGGAVLVVMERAMFRFNFGGVFRRVN